MHEGAAGCYFRVRRSIPALKMQRAGHPSAVFGPITYHFRWPRNGCAKRPPRGNVLQAGDPFLLTNHQLPQRTFTPAHRATHQARPGDHMTSRLDGPSERRLAQGNSDGSYGMIRPSWRGSIHSPRPPKSPVIPARWRTALPRKRHWLPRWRDCGKWPQCCADVRQERDRWRAQAERVALPSPLPPTWSWRWLRSTGT
jgi:hypothetical protein